MIRIYFWNVLIQWEENLWHCRTCCCSGWKFWTMMPYGLGLMRQGGEGQASHSYPLDPAWMQRSEVTWRTVCSIIAWLRQQWPPRVLRANWEHFIWIAYKNKLKEKKATFVAHMKAKLGRIWFNDIPSKYRLKAVIVAGVAITKLF